MHHPSRLHHYQAVTMILFKALILLPLLALATNASLQTQTYLVHMDKTKIAVSHQSQTNAKQFYESLMDSVAELSSKDDNTADAARPEILHFYDSAISGFSAKLTTKQLELLRKADGFLSAYPDELLSLHTTHSHDFLGLELGRGLWNQRILSQDVIIGVVDTGIWPEHVSFQDKGLHHVPSRWKGTCEVGKNFSSSNCNNKIIGARVFYQGYESIVGRINETEDFRSPRDAQGHGTHTASTAAGYRIQDASFYDLAKGAFASGMRFSSRIAVYKACWQSGCASSDVIAAIDKATSDGVDVISLSLGGSSRPFYVDPIAIASFGAIEKKVFVSCSAGNSGPSKSTVSNGAPWLMTVAASYTDRNFPALIKLGNGNKFIGSSLNSGKNTRQLLLAFNETAGGAGAQYCIKNSLKKDLVKGKIVVCLRGFNGRTEKGEQVRLNGGAAMLMVNTGAQGEELLADAHVLPAASLGASAGNSILKYINSSRNTTASIFFKGTVYGGEAPVLAAFSSRGPSVAGPEIIKPDLSAPGMNILAAWSLFSSPSLLKSDKRRVQFNIISGTSMSCPHISGLAALIKSAHRDWSPAMIKSALMTTAYTINNKKQPIQDISSIGSASATRATPFALGSGHVDPEAASDPGLVYDISTLDYLNYLCSLNYTVDRIRLFSGKNYSCPTGIVLQPGDLNYPSFAVNFGVGGRSNKTLTYKRTMTNVGLAKCSYSLQVEEPPNVKVRVEPRVLRFKKLGEKLEYRVMFVPKASRKSGESSFGALIWISRKYRVRSPIAATWM